jgi:hypothetical protein
VARPLLYRAFKETYGLAARGILGPARTGLPTYRWALATLVPAFLNAQIVLLRGRLPDEKSDQAQTKFLLTISRSEYAATWRKTYSKPGIRAHLLAFVVVVIPKLGRLKVLDIESPSTSTEDLFLRSVDNSVDLFRQFLAQLRTQPERDLQLEDLDLDTGKRVVPGAYELVDRTYAKLVMQIVQHKVSISPELRDLLLAYYGDPDHAPHTNDDPKEVPRLAHAIDVLRRGYPH